MYSRSKLAATSLVGLAAIVLVLWTPLGYLGSQEKKDDKPKPKEKEEVIETRGEVAKKAKYTANDQEKNDPKAAKVEKRAGVFTCDVHIDNRTPWTIHKILIDRHYVGSVGPYGDAIDRDVLSGSTELYAEADFRDGSVRYWGPVVVNCPSYMTYVFTLNPR